MPVFSDGLRLKGKSNQQWSGTCRPLWFASPIRTEKEMEMKTSMFRICSALAIALSASIPSLQAQQHTLEGVWNVSVTVTNCNTGAIIRTVHSIQAYHHDGTLAETANTSLRGPS